METGACLLQYLGHCGSVNSISFSPLTSDVTDLMVVTASGDQSAHIWKASVSLPSSATVAVLPSSEDELDPSSDHEDADGSCPIILFDMGWEFGYNLRHPTIFNEHHEFVNNFC